MSDKIRVYDVFSEVHPDDGITSVANTLDNARQAETSGEWENITLEWAGDYEFSTPKWSVVGYRWENDKEYSKRMKDLEKVAELAKKAKEKEKVDERKLYEKLKKKYGDK